MVSEGIGGANFEVIGMSGKAVVVIIVILIGTAFFYRATPICRTDFIPMFVLLDGWSCVPGYKPDKAN